MTRASIIMTVYNRAGTLPEAVESVLTQTTSDFDLILWDDGSSDGSVAVAERYAERDSRVRVFTAPHTGRAPALIAAINSSDAPFFGILDSDDRLAPGALAATMQAMQSDPDIAIVYTDHRIIDAQGRDLGKGARCAIPYSPERVLLNQMVFHFRLYRREIYDEVGGFDPCFECAQDYDLVLRMSEAGDIRHIAEILYDYRVHNDSISVARYRDQIEYSRRAVEKTLERRGVADQIAIQVAPDGTMALVTKT